MPHSLEVSHVETSRRAVLGVRSWFGRANVRTEGRSVWPLRLDALGRRRIRLDDRRRRRERLRLDQREGLGALGVRRRISRQRAVRDRLHVSAADERARDQRHVDARDRRHEREHLPPVFRLQLRRARRTRAAVRADRPRRDAFQQRRVHRTRRSPRDAEQDAVLHVVGRRGQGVSRAERRSACRRAVDADLYQNRLRRLVVRPVLGLLRRRRSAVPRTSCTFRVE